MLQKSEWAGVTHSFVVVICDVKGMRIPIMSDSHLIEKFKAISYDLKGNYNFKQAHTCEKVKT